MQQVLSANADGACDHVRDQVHKYLTLTLDTVYEPSGLRKLSLPANSTGLLLLPLVIPELGISALLLAVSCFMLGEADAVCASMQDALFADEFGACAACTMASPALLRLATHIELCSWDSPAC